MFKGLGVTLAVGLLLASVSLGDGGTQNQGLGISGFNTAALVDNGGVASSANLTTVSQLQDTRSMGGLMTAIEGQTGILSQAAAVGSVGGGIGIDQTANGQMLQGQAFGTGLGNQQQVAGVNLGDVLTKVGTNGIGIGLQAFVGAQYQVIASPYGISVNVNIPAASTLQIAHY
jgi:hypothetical protein